jgi:hypothetical protein
VTSSNIEYNWYPAEATEFGPARVYNRLSSLVVFTHCFAPGIEAYLDWSDEYAQYANSPRGIFWHPAMSDFPTYYSMADRTPIWIRLRVSHTFKSGLHSRPDISS